MLHPAAAPTSGTDAPAAPTEARTLPSGIPAVDRAWGGLAAGSAYAVVGPRDGGRLALALVATRAAADAGARALLVSDLATDALVAAGQAVGMDLAAAHGAGRLRLLRIPDADALAARGDDGLARALADLARLVETDRPDRVIVDDLAPLAAFSSADVFADAFARFAGAVAALDAALLVGLEAPQTPEANAVLAAVQARAAGTVEIAGDGTSRRLVLHDGASGTAPETTAHAAPPPAGATMPDEPAAPAAAPPEDPPLADLPQADSEPAAATPTTADGIAMTPISPPPPADPGLATTAADPFGLGTEEFLSQGFLVDSGALSPSASPSPAHVSAAPAWSPLGSPAPAAPDADARERFTAGMNAAYATGTHFDAVAIRMQPDTPPAAHFSTLVAGLQAALGPTDDLFADESRCRAVVRLDGSDRAGALFGAVQAFVRQRLGAEANAVLAGVAAAPIPGGAPFTSGDALMAYALDEA